MRRWSELAPDEVTINAHTLFGHVWTAKDEHGDGDSNLWFHGDGPDDWASLLAGVMFHAARRGWTVGQVADCSSERGAAFARVETRDKEITNRQPFTTPNDYASLKAQTQATLAAYLGALEAV